MTLTDIFTNFHILPQFPPGAVRQAAKMPQEVSESDKTGRKDLTDKLIITIDGDDAKDFDDAISVEVLENGNYCLGVHIADVTHYVTENSPIDRAAFARGTSVYLIDTVVPMLPFELSNELCSLKPDKVRLAMSVFMEINRQGKVIDYEICESFICSKARMTYADVTKILEGDKELCAKYSHLVSMLGLMKDLAGKLNKKRVSEGSIEFETHESKITLDKDGRPTKIERYPVTLSNNIIEEFMLICNVTVAKHLTKKGLPCVYRIHEKPDLMRLERLGEVLPLLGVNFKFRINMQPKEFQNILNEVEGEDNAEVVSYLLLRSMAKAKYSENNLGHFGLGFDCYCHFTSPIRRYPDVMVHRILKESLNGQVSEKRKIQLKEASISAAFTSSVTEVNAADAELRWKDVKKAEYMAEKIGEKYDAIITHITASGFFAKLQNTAEGFVAARSLEDDIYIAADNGVSMVGLKTQKTFSIGDKIRIKVAAVDVERCMVDFEVEGMCLPVYQRRNSGRKNVSTKNAGKKEKKILRQITKAQREEKNERIELRRNTDNEKQLFENAVVSVLFDALYEKYRFKRNEKSLVGVMLFDMAANISVPVSKDVISPNGIQKMDNILISAKSNVKNTLSIIGDSFDFSIDRELEDFCTEFVSLALKHLDRCLKFESFSYKKREDEYSFIAEKIKNKGGGKE